VVKLEIVEDDSERKTGEEDEDVMFEAKVKAYRFTDGEWRERGLGPIKLLEHKDSKKIRVLMRRDKTLKICANFYVQQESKVSEHAASEKACVFTTVDCSDGDERPELYNMCIKFGSAEKREAFTAAFEDAQKKMAALPAEEGEAEAAEEKEAVAKEADALADALSGAKVEDEEKKDE
jgi:Ran-binding protein 1|tara:strand:+ start:850 stop:1383 length:534 start_codon:yes stop_codon:yes gene_type:complete